MEDFLATPELQIDDKTPTGANDSKLKRDLRVKIRIWPRDTKTMDTNT